MKLCKHYKVYRRCVWGGVIKEEWKESSSFPNEFPQGYCIKYDKKCLCEGRCFNCDFDSGLRKSFQAMKKNRSK